MTVRDVEHDVLQRLQEWFTRHCDGTWEHRFGVTIQTTDNPGWWVKISLSGTELDNRAFTPIKRGELSLDPQPPWLHCYLEDQTFHGAGDPTTLREILNVFLDWAGE